MLMPLFTVLLAAALPQATPPAANLVPVDNDLVRVVNGSGAAGQKTRPHQHGMNRVMVHLDAGHQRIAYPDGTVKDIVFKAGDVRWDPAVGTHTSENPGNTPYRIVEIEIKKPHGSPVQWPAQDPPKIDPQHYKIEFENEQVRVMRVHYGPHESAPTHEHALPRLTVNLTPQAVRLTLPDGSHPELRRALHEVAFAGEATKHAEMNLTDTPFEVVVVEFKTR